MALGHPALKILLVINFQNFVDEEGCDSGGPKNFKPHFDLMLKFNCITNHIINSFSINLVYKSFNKNVHLLSVNMLISSSVETSSEHLHFRL